MESSNLAESAKQAEQKEIEATAMVANRNPKDAECALQDLRSDIQGAKKGIENLRSIGEKVDELDDRLGPLKDDNSNIRQELGMDAPQQNR